MIAENINVGDRFGRLTVVGNFVSRNGRYWPCVCECGGRTFVSITSLKRRAVKNGGCAKCRHSLRGHGYGSSSNPTYSKYQAMKQRCSNPNHVSYSDYGAKGTKVCDRWTKFENFLSDMGECPSKDATIDRIENSKGYEPGNVQWLSKSMQARNTSRNRPTTINGVTYPTLIEACEANEVNVRMVIGRLSRGWSEERAVLQPKHPTKGRR